MTQDAKRELERGRLTRLFDFLKAYVDLRYPPVRDIAQQLRVLWLDERPDHPAVELFRDETEEDQRTDDFAIVLRVARPPTTACPAPPAPLNEWLKDGWQHLDGKVEIHPSRNVPAEKGRARIERFEDEPRRAAVLEHWRKAREEWITNERPARAALEWFQKIYEWWDVLEREGERVEMLVGDGLLRCPDELGDFEHPVLLQKVELELARRCLSLRQKSRSFTKRTLESCWKTSASWLNDGLPVPVTPAEATDLARRLRPASIPMGRTDQRYDDQ